MNITNASSAISVLMIGGAADGLRVTLASRTRDYRHSYDGGISLYAVHTIVGAFQEAFYVGVQNLNDCPICTLVAGYHKPREHCQDLNVAEHLVTLLGGKADGRQIAIPSNKIFVPAAEMGDSYQIVPLICKDGRTFRVGILDVMSVDPIKMLYEGYRK